MEIGPQQGLAMKGQNGGGWMDGWMDERMDAWTDRWTQAEECNKAPGVISHHGVLQAGLRFGITPMLVYPEGLWLGAGVGWLQSMVLGAGQDIGVLCWSRGFFGVLMCTYLSKQFIPCPPAP